MTKAVKTERLREVLAAYGAKPSNWPEDERAELDALLKSGAVDFEGDIEDAGKIDLILNSNPGPKIPDGALARAMAIAAEHPKAEVLEFRARSTPVSLNTYRSNLRQILPTGIALAASLAVGVFVGLNEQIGTYLPDSLSVASVDVGTNTDDELLNFDPFNLSDGEVL